MVTLFARKKRYPSKCKDVFHYLLDICKSSKFILVGNNKEKQIIILDRLQKLNVKHHDVVTFLDELSKSDNRKKA